MRLRLSAAMEELEVDKLIRERNEAAKGSEFDSLYQEVKSNQETEAALVEPKEDESTETEPVTDDASASDTETDESDGEVVSTESLSQLHLEAIHGIIATEDGFVKDTLSRFGKAIGSKALDGMQYLKDVGVEYGPVLLHHVYKGVVYTITKSLKAITKGSVLIAGYIKQYLESYNRYEEKIQDARKALELIKNDEEFEDQFFDKPVTISRLKIAESVDFNQNVKIVEAFINSFFNTVGHKVQSDIHGVNHLIASVVHSSVKEPERIMKESFGFTGFEKAHVSGYESNSEYCDTYVYKHVLPGDILFIGHSPRSDLLDRSQIIDAYKQSDLFFGINQKTSGAVQQCRIMTKDELTSLLDHLEAICKIGLDQERTLNDIVKTRNVIRISMKTYLRFLLSAKEKISIRDSLSEFISLKLAFMDQTYVNGVIKSHDYLSGLMTAALEYTAFCIKARS